MITDAERVEVDVIVHNRRQLHDAEHVCVDALYFPAAGDLDIVVPRPTRDNLSRSKARTNDRVGGRSGPRGEETLEGTTRLVKSIISLPGAIWTATASLRKMRVRFPRVHRLSCRTLGFLGTIFQARLDPGTQATQGTPLEMKLASCRAA